MTSNTRVSPLIADLVLRPNQPRPTRPKHSRHGCRLPRWWRSDRRQGLPARRVRRGLRQAAIAHPEHPVGKRPQPLDPALLAEALALRSVLVTLLSAANPHMTRETVEKIVRHADSVSRVPATAESGVLPRGLAEVSPETSPATRTMPEWDTSQWIRLSSGPLHNGY